MSNEKAGGNEPEAQPQVTKSSLRDVLDSHPLPVIVSVVIASAGFGWILSEKLRVEPRDFTITTLTNQNQEYRSENEGLRGRLGQYEDIGPREGCLESQRWYTGDAVIVYDNRGWVKFGPTNTASLDIVEQVGEYQGVPIFAGKRARTPYPEIWLPLCSPPQNTYQPYRSVDEVRGAG